MERTELVSQNGSAEAIANDFFGDFGNCDENGTNIWIVVRRHANATQPTMRDWGIIVSWLDHRQMRAITRRCFEVSHGRPYSGESLPFEHGCLITIECHFRSENGITVLEPRVECYQICHTTFVEWLCMGEYVGTTSLSIRDVVLMSGTLPTITLYSSKSPNLKVAQSRV